MGCELLVLRAEDTIQSLLAGPEELGGAECGGWGALCTGAHMHVPTCVSR